MTSANLPQVAAAAGQALVVWSDDRSGQTGIYGARFRADGTLADPTGFPISPTGTLIQAQLPAVASDGSSFLVVWTSLEIGLPTQYRGVHATRVNAVGQVLDPTPIVLSASAASGGDRPGGGF